MTKIFAFFVEPSSYTSDLIENIHEKLHINYIFLKRNSLAKKDGITHINYLGSLNILQQIAYVYNVFRKNEIIIFNGYIHWQFIMLFFLNMLSFKKRVIAIESDTQFRETKGLKGWLKNRYLRTIFGNNFTLGFSGGSGSHKDLFRNYGMHERNIFLMPMMVNNAYFMNHQAINLPNFSFLYVGRIIPIKNIEFMIQSFLQTFRGIESVQLKIVGAGELESTLKKKYAGENNIIFRGAKFGEDLVSEYHTSNVLVLPSSFEPWGLVVNEAMSASLPVITSSEVGANFDLILNKETGYVFDIDKDEDLSEKMFQMFSNKQTYTLYAANALDLMKNYWNYDLYRENLISAIKHAKGILKH